MLKVKGHRLNILLLAAGKGLRFQQSCAQANQPDKIKQLATIQGIPMINHSINQLRPLKAEHNLSNNIYVVLGENHQQIHAVLPDDVTPFLSKSYSEGMGHTIAESVARLTDESSHILIALVDQVLISTEHYQQMINKSLAEPDKIIATSSANKLMAPAIFPKKYFSELMKLQGDKGAGALLKRYVKHEPTQIITLPCSPAQLDVDTLADLEHICSLLSPKTL